MRRAVVILFAASLIAAAEPPRTADEVKRELAEARAKVAALEAELEKLGPVKIEPLSAKNIGVGKVGRFEGDRGPVNLVVRHVNTFPDQYVIARVQGEGLSVWIEGAAVHDLAEGKVLPHRTWVVDGIIIWGRTDERMYKLVPHPKPVPFQVPPPEGPFLVPKKVAPKSDPPSTTPTHDLKAKPGRFPVLAVDAGTLAEYESLLVSEKPGTKVMEASGAVMVLKGSIPVVRLNEVGELTFLRMSEGDHKGKSYVVRTKDVEFAKR